MIDKTDPHTLHAYIDIRSALRSNDSGCFAYHWTGGVRSSDPSSAVIAAAVYVWQPADSEASACGFSLAGSHLPEVTVHLTAPLGSREVIDAATGSQVPVVKTPPPLSR
jgi:hypothetical protein